MMDGLALRSGDCVEEGAWLRELGQAPAGTPFEGGVTPGSCVRVMTGGVVPSGADAVVPVELVTAERLGQQDGYRIRASARPGQHVASRGSEVREGERVVAAGERLTAARVGVLASFGCSEPSVFHRPRVSVVPTGTEIVSIDDRPGLGQVRNSNAWALRAHFGSLGGEVELVDAVIDDQVVLDRALASAAERSELIVTCGGVSMGDYDLVVGSLRRLGAEIQFHRVALKPGKPVLLARLGSAWVLGLPGNPVSAMTCATLFGQPLMARLSGERGARWRVTRAKLAGAIKGTRSRVEFRPGRWTRDGAVTPVKTAGSADLAHFAAGDASLCCRRRCRRVNWGCGRCVGVDVAVEFRGSHRLPRSRLRRLF